jgi:hypothetical protein
MDVGTRAYLEDIKESTAVEARLLVGGSEHAGLDVLLRVETGGQVELETLGHVVLELNLGAEDVCGRPCLSEDKPVRLVGVLGLDVTVDSRAFRVAETGDAESSARRGVGFDLEGGTVEVVVLAKQVVGRLAEILPELLMVFPCRLRIVFAYLPRRGNRLRERHSGEDESTEERMDDGDNRRLAGQYPISHAARSLPNPGRRSRFLEVPNPRIVYAHSL